MSDRNWVTFRQFDQALSDYYEENQVSIPIYTGHFQPDSLNGCKFSVINNTLQLYGSNDYKNSFPQTTLLLTLTDMVVNMHMQHRDL